MKEVEGYAVEPYGYGFILADYRPNEPVRWSGEDGRWFSLPHLAGANLFATEALAWESLAKEQQ